MIRVLHSVSNMDRAGIETMLMNYYQHIDREKIQFDFLVNKPKPGDYDEQIRKMGGRIFLSPGLNPIHYPKYMKFTDALFKDNPEIRILHAHNEAMGLYALNGAKRAGIKPRIAHAHNTRLIRDYKYPLKIFCKQFLAYSATELWGCGRDAGIYFFGKKNWSEKGMVMRNAIETKDYAFSPEIRGRMRREHHLGEKTVIGHVGRFNMQKNHDRILNIFAAYTRIDPNAVLLLIGEGELEDKIKEKAKKMQLTDKVIFAGLQSNVHEWYMAMDLFLMPSLFEGLPVVGIEAQATGLKCLFSDAVTDEIVLSPYADRMPLQASDDEWAKKLLELLKKSCDRTEGISIIRDAGYDIAVEAKRIEALYLKMSERSTYGAGTSDDCQRKE